VRKLLTGLVLSLPLFASGQASDSANDRIESLVEELKSSSFVTRELAEKDLQFEQSIALEELETQLRRDDLTPEQRIRLLKAASMRFASEPRGAMGINLTNELSQLGLKIGAPVAGFDSAVKLQAGDIISTISGLPIRSTADLQITIISRSPGDTVPVEIVRDGQKLTLDVELGAWSQLNSPGGLPRSYVEAAWVFRSRDYAGLDEPEIIEFEADPNAWNQAAMRGWSGQSPRRNTGEPIRSAVVIGGEARPRPGSMAGVRLERPLSPSARGRASDFPPLLRQELNKTELDILSVQERIRRQKAQIQLYKQNATRLGTIQQAEQQLAEFELISDELNRRAERLRQELSDLGIQDP